MKRKGEGEGSSEPKKKRSRKRILIGSLSGPNFETEAGDKGHQRVSFGDYYFKTM